MFNDNVKLNVLLEMLARHFSNLKENISCIIHLISLNGMCCLNESA